MNVPEGEPTPWITLLVLQPSPFCNINCDYCYLPHRTSMRRMSFDVLRSAIQRTFASDLVKGELTLIWHAGEPLAVPISWYEQAFAIIREVIPEGAKIRHSFQSNGTLLNQAWCDFIKRENIFIGLSIDGPAFLHDAHRKTRGGQGTHAAAVRGARLLQENQIDYHVISVITKEALDHAEEIYNFFETEGTVRLGLNIEETEAYNETSSLDGAEHSKVRAFYETIFRLQKDRRSIVIREFDAAKQKILSGMSLREFSFPWFNEQARPFGIVNVDWEGNFSTYSPELLGMDVAPYGPFAFGNVLTDDFSDVLETEKFRTVLTDIQTGLKRCESTCSYYGYCGGGAPANKYYENGSFNSTQTQYCRYSVQLPLDIVLADIEKDLAAAA